MYASGDRPGAVDVRSPADVRPGPEGRLGAGCGAGPGAIRAPATAAGAESSPTRHPTRRRRRDRPDPPGLRCRPVPAAEPLPALRIAERRGGVRPEEVLLPLPPGTPTEEGADPDRPGPRDSPALPDPRLWGSQFAQAAVEVAAGLRSPTQLVRWVSDEVHSTLARRGTLTSLLARGRPGTPRHPLVCGIHVCRVGPGVCEASAVVSEQGRVRAVAFRMEERRARWWVTALELG